MRFLNHAKFLSNQKKRSFLIRLDNVEICKTSQTFEEPFKSLKNLKVLHINQPWYGHIIQIAKLWRLVSCSWRAGGEGGWEGESESI